MFARIITVCTGNICRSPLAEASLRRELGENRVEVQSAGIAALVDSPADALACEVALEHGLNLADHRARQLTRQLLVSNDLILVLDAGHERWITQRFPEFRGKTFRLGRWNNNRSIADPYRQPKAAFDQALQEINEGIALWLPRIS